jgi:hypothetical protein
MPEATTLPTRRRPPATRVAVVDPASRARWIEAFYVAEAKAELGRQASSNQRRTQ